MLVSHICPHAGHRHTNVHLAQKLTLREMGEGGPIFHRDATNNQIRMAAQPRQSIECTPLRHFANWNFRDTGMLPRLYPE